MGTVILLRHGRSTANGSGVLAGRAPKVGLDETGRAQAEALAGRLAAIPLSGLVVSPLLRCKQTVAPLAAAQKLERVVDARLSEVDYGEWTGRAIKDLVSEPLWRVVQAHPSAAVFPGGEGLAAMQARAVEAVREHDARITAAHGDHAVWLLCSHGDVLKSLIADALGQHLDSFQRIVVDPGSISVVTYTETRPFVVKVNDNGGDLSGLVPPKPQRGKKKGKKSSDAVIGGSTGRKGRA
ncbi:histidine phosphatase family protein [Amycolatopsis magusensis]|uniref:Phosphomutase (TIGR03848 family) n=1 Tax=Amycolatopsis magusensis TaxID=882444 RepID=A0ABS4PWX2_9PSEU|nr:histidine phosphatase family protein [Amycolatopsis magusensis]MBP2183922.1 putative phosphomutase (TIGR03848 family) [Amycolatopsis magusensis]MDI5977952.1 histidine phosphatase family protein [Amycolatopsis magusensis]UJW30021.1 MSMEG_4193 family putative phosphomutase [Saccharothrix sp. AJ9571]